MTIIIRDSTPDDAEALSACQKILASERSFYPTTTAFDVAETRNFIHSVWKGGGIQLVAVSNDDGTIVGWCDVTALPFEAMHHVCRLGMGLQKPFRGQGFGRIMLCSVIRRVFANERFSRIELEVVSSNTTAMKLYERNGFVVEGRKRDGWILDGIHADRIVMGLLREDWNDDIDCAG